MLQGLLSYMLLIVLFMSIYEAFLMFVLISFFLLQSRQELVQVLRLRRSSFVLSLI